MDTYHWMDTCDSQLALSITPWNSPHDFLCEKLQALWKNILGFLIYRYNFFDERIHAA